MKKWLTFIWQTLISSVILGVVFIITGYLASYLGYILFSSSSLGIILIYPFILLYIFIFFKFKPESYSKYVLPLSFLLISLILYIWANLYPGSEGGNFMLTIIFLVYYALPFFILTLIIAAILNRNAEVRQPKDEKNLNRCLTTIAASLFSIVVLYFLYSCLSPIGYLFSPLFYGFTLIYILLFLKFKPKSCSAFALPISFFLIWIIPKIMELLHCYLYLYFNLNIFYTLPCFILTLIIAIYPYYRKKFKQQKEDN